MTPSPTVQERAQWYVGRAQNPLLIAGQVIEPALSIKTDSDAPFRLTSIGLYVLSGAGAAQGAAGNIGITVRLYRPDGAAAMEKHILTAQAVNPYDAQAPNGAGGQTATYFSLPTPIHSNILWPAGAAITFDYAALAGITNSQVIFVFGGTKLYRPGAFWGGQYPPAPLRTRPFFGYVIQLPLANLPLYDYQLLIQRDADFVLQNAVQTSYLAAALAPVGAIRGLGIKMKDWNGKYYMNDYVPIELIFGGFAFSQTPGIVYPEIYVPKNQALYFDLNWL
jgi:hypothetical protein